MTVCMYGTVDSLTFGTVIVQYGTVPEENQNTEYSLIFDQFAHIFKSRGQAQDPACACFAILLVVKCNVHLTYYDRYRTLQAFSRPARRTHTLLTHTRALMWVLALFDRKKIDRRCL